ncbi:MAG: ABC transporter permease subunit, partial [Nannocystaceae bacterium]
MTARAALASLLSHLLLVAAVGFALYPVLWVVALAFSGAAEPAARAIPLPVDPTLDHLQQVVGTTKVTADGSSTWLFGRQLANSLLVSIATAVVGVGVAIPVAYALARFDFVGKSGGIATLLATQMFPAVASAVPLFLILESMGLLNTRSGLILCYASTSVPFAIFQLRGAFETIPVDLEEAAMVDGASRFEAFVRVVLPVAKPAIAV